MALYVYKFLIIEWRVHSLHLSVHRTPHIIMVHILHLIVCVSGALRKTLRALNWASDCPSQELWKAWHLLR